MADPILAFPSAHDRPAWFKDSPAHYENLFWAKIDPRPGGCWLWTASTRNKGYGAFCLRRGAEYRQDRAHRVIFELYNGPIPSGLFVLHTCDVPACCNPRHLWLGTIADNNRDMHAKGRSVKGGTLSRDGYRFGEEHQGVKFSSAVVANVITDRAAGLSYSQLSARHGVSPTHAWKIVKGLRRPKG